MLAYHVEWQMRARLKPMLYDDADKEAAEAARDNIVAKAKRSPAAVTKLISNRTEDGLPVHSFHSLLADLATLTRNTVVTALAPDHPFTLTTRPTTIQRKALDLLGVAVTCTQYPPPPTTQYRGRSMHCAQSKKEVTVKERQKNN